MVGLVQTDDSVFFMKLNDSRKPLYYVYFINPNLFSTTFESLFELEAVLLTECLNEKCSEAVNTRET